MVTPAPPDRRRASLPDRGADDRAQAPIRWPHPDRSTVGLIALWAVGLLVALFLPALIVAPTVTHPPVGHVWLAFGSTVAGSLVMLGATGLLWRRRGDASVMLMGAVPAFACVAGGCILAASKLTGG
jgi:hypothetical protein